jgi:regulatory protein
MNFITAITPVPRHPGRFDVQVNGKSLAILSLDAIERLRLTVGVGVAGREEQIAEEAAALKVYDRALDMLAFRGRSSVELARSLVRKGEPKVLVDRAVDRLLEQGLLDDAAFAESFTRAKVLGAQHSRRRVQQDLARKGVGRELSAVAIARVFDEEGVDQRAVVEQAARKKLRSLTKLDPAVRRRRLYAFLARRGFDSDDIRRVMDGLGQALRGGEDVEE